MAASRQINFVKDLNRRVGEFKSRWRRMKKSGQLEGITKGQSPGKLLVASPMEVLYLKSGRNVPGTEFGVSWSPDDYAAKASIFYAIEHLKIRDVVILGEKGTQNKIEKELKSYSFMPADVEITKAEKYKEVDRERIKGVFIDCSDSRVLGGAMLNNSSDDMVMVSNAGNILSMTAADTIQAIVKEANPLVVGIMGHNYCGAVNAACAGVEEAELKPLLDGIRADLNIKEPVEATMDVYTENVIKNLERLAKVVPEIEEKGIAILPLMFSLDNGSTKFVSPNGNGNSKQ